jgi:hypothetical protein
MSKLFVVGMSTLAVFAFSSSSFAEPVAPTRVQTAPTSAVQQISITPNSKYTVSQAEFSDLGGQYQLSNGETLRFSSWGNRFYVQGDSMPKTEVKPVAQNVFMARDSSVTLKFQPETNQEATKLVLTLASKN